MSSATTKTQVARTRSRAERSTVFRCCGRGYGRGALTVGNYGSGGRAQRAPLAGSVGRRLLGHGQASAAITSCCARAQGWHKKGWNKKQELGKMAASESVWESESRPACVERRVRHGSQDSDIRGVHILYESKIIENIEFKILDS